MRRPRSRSIRPTRSWPRSPQGGLKADYVFPRDETKKDDVRPTGGQLLEKTGAYGAVQFITHGDPPFMRIEVGKQGKEVKNYMATGPEFRKHLNFPAPTAVYVIGCHVGTVYAPFRSNDDFLPHVGRPCGSRGLHGPAQLPGHLLLACTLPRGRAPASASISGRTR